MTPPRPVHTGTRVATRADLRARGTFPALPDPAGPWTLPDPDVCDHCRLHTCAGQCVDAS